jgi:RNA polymerase sigma-70 factor (ECF subfamily)
MDSKQVEGLFRAYRGSVHRRASAILADKDMAQDVTQEVFLKVLNRVDDFLQLESPMAWLYRVTTNVCLKRLRDASRRRRILGMRAEIPSTATDLPADAALTVHKLLCAVPEKLQEVAVYYYVDQMSQEEISTIMEMPRRTVSYRLEQFRVAMLTDDNRTRTASR